MSEKMTSAKAGGCPDGEEESQEAAVSVPNAFPTRSSTITPKLCLSGSGECVGVNNLTPRCSAEYVGLNSLAPRCTGGCVGENTLTPGRCVNKPVPRSFSDTTCHHCRAGSDVSSETSRASAGASLEKFFTQMGMERDVLDPMVQLQQRGAGLANSDKEAVFESISSLDSHDARSICSALSRSEKETSDSESCERNQQQASAVERNARIIKWLCNVRKAKTPATTVHSGSAS